MSAPSLAAATTRDDEAAVVAGEDADGARRADASGTQAAGDAVGRRPQVGVAEPALRRRSPPAPAGSGRSPRRRRRPSSAPTRRARSRRAGGGRVAPVAARLGRAPTPRRRPVAVTAGPSPATLDEQFQRVRAAHTAAHERAEHHDAAVARAKCERRQPVPVPRAHSRRPDPALAVNRERRQRTPLCGLTVPAGPPPASPFD